MVIVTVIGNVLGFCWAVFDGSSGEAVERGIGL